MVHIYLAIIAVFRHILATGFGSDHDDNGVVLLSWHRGLTAVGRCGVVLSVVAFRLILLSLNKFRISEIIA